MIRNKLINISLLLLCSITLANAQKVVNADKIVAVLGDNIILSSDIEGQYAQYISQGYPENEEIKCQILDGILIQKMLQNQAALDSLEISENQVEDELNRRINYFISQAESQEKLEQFLGRSILEFKEELREDIRSMLMAQTMQGEITKNVSVTPSEVRKFYENIPTDSLPYFNTEVEIAVIVKKPIVSKQAKQEAIDKLESLRKRVAEGEDFATLAILYSQDVSAKSGGELGFVNRGELVKAFESVAFKLKPGELSSIVETEYGYHIVQLIERRGEQVNVRHILIKPTTGFEDLEKTRKELDSVANLIRAKKMTFAEAAAKFSDDESTKNNGGLMQNVQEGGTKIPTDQLDPSLYFTIDNMNVGDLSQPLLFKNATNEQAYRIVQYVSKIEPHSANLKDDYQKVQQAALTAKQNKAIEEWFDKKRKTTYIRLSDDYNYCDRLKPWYDSVKEEKAVKN